MILIQRLKLSKSAQATVFVGAFIALFMFNYFDVHIAWYLPLFLVVDYLLILSVHELNKEKQQEAKNRNLFNAYINVGSRLLFIGLIFYTFLEHLKL